MKAYIVSNTKWRCRRMNEQQLKRRIERIEKRIQEYEEKKEVLSVHGHWSLGYYQGKLSALEDWLDCVQALKGGVSNE